MKLLYKLFYKGFLKYQKGTIKPKEQLKYAFTDIEGKNYYTWNDKGEMPQVRFERLMDLMQFWEAKVSPKTLEEIADGIIVSIETSLTAPDPKLKNKALANVIVFANELKLRKEAGIPSGIFKEMCALFSIREDENPVVLDMGIHEEKIQALTIEEQNGRDFFFKLPHLQVYLSLSRMSRSELKKQLNQSQVKERETSAIITHLLSGFKSSKEGQTVVH